MTRTKEYYIARLHKLMEKPIENRALIRKLERKLRQMGE